MANRMITIEAPLPITPSNIPRLLPMTDHYALLCGEEVVGVVCKSNETQWEINLLRGRINGVANYIPLGHALQTAMTWRP